jgi:hypothetical protein
MIPMARHIRALVHAFLYDELAATRWVRGVAVAVAIGGTAFANELSGIVDAPGLVKTIKVVSLSIGFIAGSITASRNTKAEVADDNSK